MTEHPVTCAEERCITCSDTATPMTVLQLDRSTALALCVDEQGACSTVDVALLATVALGDTVLVHAGAAIHRVAV